LVHLCIEKNYRRYCAKDISAIEFLTKLRLTGMPIRKMQQFAILFRQQPEAISDRRKILEAHEQEVIERIVYIAFIE
jgi:DNA-binding transcriptional MerR regulator